jgi:hypothetical protein
MSSPDRLLTNVRHTQLALDLTYINKPVRSNGTHAAPVAAVMVDRLGNEVRWCGHEGPTR